MSATPLHSAIYPSPVYADPAATMSGGTPLIVAVSRAGRTDDYHVTVRLQLLQAYERAIFELQQQVAHYKALVDDLLPKVEQSERLRLDPTPLNAGSVRLLDSMVKSRMPAVAQPHGYDESDEVW
jgi:hypothetical protein